VKLRFFAALVLALGATAPARAAAPGDSVEACGSAAVDGQKLWRAGRLKEARGRFEICSRPSCREDIVHDCGTWLAEIDRAMPSVVVTARDAAGHVLTDVSVSIDGRVRDDGLLRPVPLDPGEHVVVLERSNATPLTRTITLREGDRMELAMVFAEQPRSSAKGLTEGRPLPTPVFVAGGIGAVSLGAFGIFGAIGYADWRSSHCNEGCAQADAARVRRELVIADVSLVIAVVSTAAATWFYLGRSRDSAQTHVGVR
jgi:hypothetical protein